MGPRAKLSSEQRRAAIIQAVRRVFAEKGFHGTTTRALADAAGVSEALLFKHFPNKEALFSAMQLSGEELAIQNRLMLRSFAEDGEFARLALRGLTEFWIPKVGECLKAAVVAGDALAGPVRASSSGWFAHHLPVIIMTHLLPAKPVVDYGLSRDELVEQAVWFILRGMGLKEEAIRRYYNPKALTLLMG